ncbi:MAG: type II secretion system F family protein [bacterium]
MATFSYVARDQAGQTQQGTADADNDVSLRKQLRERGLWVQQISQVKGGAGAKAGAKGGANATAAVTKKGKKKVRIGRVKQRDLTMFCRQFATMINAGVSLVRCLAVLEQQATAPSLKNVIRELSNSVEQGETLTRAMQRYPHIFNNLFVGLVRAGEVGGVLDETMERLSTFLEEDMKLVQKFKSAMTYPTVVMSAALLIVWGLVTFIVPKFMELFKDFGMTLPGPTLFLMNISNAMSNPTNIGITVGTVVGLVFAINRIKATKSGKRILDKMMLKAPVFGVLIHKVAIARFARTMGTLLASGVPILQALETVAGALDNEVISGAVLDARTAVREGERVGDPLERSKLFPPMIIQMIAIGEETGTLDSMLEKVADFYESEVEAAMESLTSAIEPLLIIFLGGVVGFIVVAMFMPLVKLIDGLSK